MEHAKPMHEKPHARLVREAVAARGWTKPSELAAAVNEGRDEGDRVTLQTAINWWHGGNVSERHRARLCNALGIDFSAFVLACAGIEADDEPSDGATGAA